MADITPKYEVPTAEQEIVVSDSFDGGLGQSLGGFQVGAQEFKQGKITLQGVAERILIGEASDPLAGIGIFMGNDNATPIGYDFRVGDPDGDYLHWDASAGTLTIVGSVTTTVGATIAGFDIGTDYIRDVANTFGLASTVSGSDDVRFWAGASFASRATAPFRVTEAGIVNASNITITGGSVPTSILTGSIDLTSLDLAAAGWNQTSAFSVTDSDTVAWGAGVFRTAKGTSYSIGAGNTGNMSAKTYIYLDIAVSTTAYQTTTTQTTAVGTNKVLVAVAQNGTTEARFMLFNDNQFNIDAANIVAGTVTSNEIAASTITGTNILTLNISGKTATFDTGTIGGFTMAATTLSATNFSVVSGAANTARLTVGSGSNLAGMNSGNAGSDIAFWAGDTHTNRATAPFRVDLDGNVVMESATIDGYVVTSQGAFGGDGSDGALTISSGTTTIDLAGAMRVIKNYTSISITGTGKLAFSNPHANGTVIILKSQGGVTVTSSGSPTIDVRSMGGGNPGTATSVYPITAESGTENGPTGASEGAGLAFLVPAAGGVQLACGAQGDAGGPSFFGGSGGAGGRGGGALYIECAGALDFGASATITADGADGANGSNGNNGGGGGGGAGTIVILYTTLTANAGTITADGGDGGDGTGGGGGGGTGASGGGSISNGGGGGGSGNDFGPGGGGGGGNGGSAGSAGTLSIQGGGGGGGGGGSWLVAKNTVLA